LLKTSTIWLKNSSVPMGFPLKVTELLTWYTFPIYLNKINEEDFPQLIKGAKGGNLNNNPRDVSDEDLIELLYKMTGLC